MKTLARVVWTVLVLLALTMPLLAQEDYEINTIHSIQYADGAAFEPQRRQILDLYIPQDAEDFPVLLFIHGGAWVTGSKNLVANVGRTFARHGIGVAAVNYRLSPQATHPAHIEDIAQAYAWIVDHIADYGGDPSRIVVGGHSAGGHLASLLALDAQYLEAVGHSPDEISGVLAISGVFWIDDWIMNWAVGAFPADQAGRDAASPLQQVHADAPPFLLLVSEHDYPELIVETEVMQAALQAAEVTVEGYVIADRNHGSIVAFIGSPEDATTGYMLDWLGSIFAPAD